MVTRVGTKRALWPVVGAAAALGLLVFWYTPAILYTSNERQFTFPLRQILPMLFLPIIATIVVCLLISLLMPRRFRPSFAIFLGVLTVFFYVRGFVLVGDYGLLDGEVNLPEFHWWPVATSVLIVIALTVALSHKRVRRSLIVTVFAIAMIGNTGHLVALVVGDPKVSHRVDASARPLFELGDQNLIVILLDALQSDVFSEVLAQRNDIRDAFDGFTYYPNTLGIGRSTYASLPSIHSGSAPERGGSMQDNFDLGIGEQSFMTDLADDGWSTALINPTRAVCPARVSHCFKYDANSQASTNRRLAGQASELADLTLFRLAPPELKASVYNENRWRVRSHFNVRSEQESSDIALDDFSRNLRVGSPGKTAHFLHLFSTHAPATRDGECNLLEEPLEIDRTTAMANAACALSRVAQLIRSLEQRGAYDDTSIILLSDHGYRPGSVPSPLVSDPEWESVIGNANPTLAVKPARATHPIGVDRAELWLADVRQIVCSLTGACPASDWQHPDADRVRAFMDYQWSDAFWSASTLKGERRFEIRGSMIDPQAWRELSQGTLPFVSQLTFGPTDSPLNFGYGWGRWQNGEGGESRWTLGNKALLLLNLPHTVESELIFKLGALPEFGRQQIRLFLNGDELTRMDVNGLEDEISVIVPVGAARKEIDELRMEFDHYRSADGIENRHQRLQRSFAIRYDDLQIRSYG